MAKSKERKLLNIRKFTASYKVPCFKEVSGKCGEGAEKFHKEHQADGRIYRKSKGWCVKHSYDKIA